MTDVLALQSVGLRFGAGAEVLAGVDLAVEPAGVTLVCGPAGSGKSLLLDIAGLVRRPNRGGVRLFGLDPWDASADRAAFRRRLGWVEQRPVRLHQASAADEAALPLRLMGMAAHEATQRATELLAWMGSSAQTAPIARAQRVALARAVIHGPELVLIDAVDEYDGALRERLGRLIQRLQPQGTSFLLTARDPAVAAELPPSTAFSLRPPRVTVDKAHRDPSGRQPA